jgi:hypothetical protein
MTFNMNLCQHNNLLIWTRLVTHEYDYELIVEFVINWVYPRGAPRSYLLMQRYCPLLDGADKLNGRHRP